MARIKLRKVKKGNAFDFEIIAVPGFEIKGEVMTPDKADRVAEKLEGLFDRVILEECTIVGPDYTLKVPFCMSQELWFDGGLTPQENIDRAAVLMAEFQRTEALD